MKTKHYFLLAIIAILIISSLILKVGQISNSNEDERSFNSSPLDVQLNQVYDKINEEKAKDINLKKEDLGESGENDVTTNEETALSSGFDPVIFISPSYNETVASPLELRALLSKDWLKGDGIYLEVVNSNDVVLSAKYIPKVNFINNPESKYYSLISKIEFDLVSDSGRVQLRQEYAKDKYNYLAIPIFFNQE
jgi:hypothetical protein